ncbi:glutathione S-transferase family protein [uncultured Ramlibacter sp.]|uniref:glutathione S-transferase family protein n=1 Tax=uncultured Ramlibacter sp. TaxID=260755 RepID=UPI002622B2C7|nr:glutathione S-transferase [uncultured Ramlibacter sp.]
MTASTPPERLRLYRMQLSGHCHRVELFLSLLGLPCDLVDVDVGRGETRTPEFLALNPFGQLPVLRDGQITLADSNAILVYLEGRYAPGRWLPRDPLGAAQVQRWLSVAAGQLAFGPAAARVIQLFRRPDDPAAALARAQALLRVMEQQLASRAFLAAETPTLADIALYSYTAVAPEGMVTLTPFAAVRDWLARIEALPGFLPMVRTPVGLEA